MARQPAGRHSLSVGSLVIGLCFCGIAVAWLLSTAGVITLSSLPWVLPGLLVVSGVIGVLASLRRGKPDPDRRP